MKNKTNILQQWLPFIIAIYVMLYEWRTVCELDLLLPIVNVIKAVVPFLLIIFMLKSKLAQENNPSRKYLFYFALFMGCGLCSGLFSMQQGECLIQWLKFLFLLGFCFFICTYLLKFEAAQDRLMKIFIVVAVFAVVQYIILEVVTFSGTLQKVDLLTNRGGIYCGPFGILGQCSGNVYFKSLGFSLYRIYGFWLEPSTAAGFLLASAFFAEAAFIKTKQMIWRILGVVSFCGSVLTFSNTVYLAIGVTGLLGEAVFWKVKDSRKILRSIFIILYFLLIIFAVFGRAIVAKNFSQNIDLRYVVGVRDSIEDPYGGRIDLFKENFKVIADSKNEISGALNKTSGGGLDQNSYRIFKDLAFGIGFRISGYDGQGRGVSVFPGALVMWFVFAGIFGLIFLLLREFQVVRHIAKNIFLSMYVLRISQAWLAVFIANLSYGSLMSPFYFIAVALVFSSVHHSKMRGNIE